MTPRNILYFCINFDSFLVILQYKASAIPLQDAEIEQKLFVKNLNTLNFYQRNPKTSLTVDSKNPCHCTSYDTNGSRALGTPD